jgi:hypothetical protein
MASVRDARNDSIFGKQLTVYSQPPTMTTPTPPLSPAALAIRDAYKTGGLDAALIAAADQILPVCEPPPRSDFTDLSVWQWAQDIHHAENAVRRRFLALANELRQEKQA